MLSLGSAVVLGVSIAAAGADPALLASAYPTLRMSTGALPSSVGDLVETALPPPPDRVYLETRMYGTVMVNHRAHLARRAACKSCHGAGVVSSIAFTPKSAHDSCRSCHEQEKRGPVACADCHVQRAEPPSALAGESVRFISRAPDGTRVASATSSHPPPPKKESAAEKRLAKAAELAAATAITREAEAAAAQGFAEERLARTQHWREVGFSMMDAGRQPVPGMSLRLAMRSEGGVMTEGLEWATSARSSRLRGLLAGGFVVPLHTRVELDLVAIGGFDLRYSPALNFAPAVGVGAEVHWNRRGFPAMLGIAANGVRSLGPTTNRFGEPIGGTTWSLGLVSALGRGR